MSGIPGIFHRDGRPIDSAVLHKMIAAAPYRGPDGARVWADGPIGLAHQLLCITADETLRRQPIADVHRGVAITFDGRLDNRSELVAHLGAHDAPLDGASDAEIVLAAYGRWAEECPRKLLGDFAFAVWDARRRLVFCARDTMGIKPFYYAVDGRSFVWSTDLRQLIASGYVELEPNEGMIAESLSFGMRSQSETLYRGVMRLPAAHSMTVTADRVRIVRYWELDPTIELNYRSDEEYTEHFAAIFKDAVACRLRSDAPVAAAYLSGGLDSSSVVSMARSLGRDVETFSLLYPDVPEADERRYIDDVVARWELKARAIEARPIDGAVCRAHIGGRYDIPDLPSDLVGEDLLVLLRQFNHHVVLTGIGGDYGLTGSSFHYADFIRAGDVATLARQFVADARLWGLGSSLAEVFLSGVRPVLPKALKDAARPLARRFGWVPGVPEWVGEGLAERVGLADRLRPAGRDSAGCPASRQYVCDLFDAGWPYLILERNERSAAEYGIDERHPFFDRRLIEWCLALPESQRWRGEQTKYVLRQAMRGLLPDSVCERKDKGDFSHCVPQGVEALGGADLLDHLCIASLGWVRQDCVSAMYRKARRLLEQGDSAYCWTAFHLWNISGIELWYRTMFLNEERNGRFNEVAELVTG